MSSQSLLCILTVPLHIHLVSSLHPFPHSSLPTCLSSQSPALIHFPRSPPPTHPHIHFPSPLPTSLSSQSPPLIHSPPPPPFSHLSTSLFPQSSPLIYSPPPPPIILVQAKHKKHVAVYMELNCTIQEDIDLYVLSILYVNQYSQLFQMDSVDVRALLCFSLADSSFVVLRCCFTLSRLAVFPDVSFIKAEHSFNLLFKAALCWAVRRW